MRLRYGRRRATNLVECAVILPTTFLLILGLMIGGLGTFCYQEVSHLAREGARYASTHGGQYQLDGMPQKTGVPAVNSSADLLSYLKPRSAVLNANQLQVNVAWTAPSSITPANMPTYGNADPNAVPPGQVTIRNNVVVTVTYTWFPQAYLVGPITLTSTSQMPMSY